MAYDQACLDLAEHFLQDEPSLIPHKSDLAQHIQDEVENWIECERQHRSLDSKSP